MNVLNRNTSTVPSAFEPQSHEASAVALGSAIGHTLDGDFAILTKAKADYEGGPFVVLFNLDRHLTTEQWSTIPDHEAETGNNPRFYKTKKQKSDGKEKMTDRDYYKVVAESLPDVVAKERQIELLGRSMKDPTKFNLSDVPQAIKDMPPHRRHAEIGKLSRAINTARTNVIAALELYSQMNRAATLQGVSLDLLYAINEKGIELDGTAQAGEVRKIDDTRAPIVLTTKLARRTSIDTGRFSVSSFMRFNIPAAKEQGGSWDALLATVKKGTKEKDKDAVSSARNVETIDTAKTVTNDLAEYLVRIQDAKDGAAWEALKKATQGAGSDDFFQNLCWIKASVDLLVGDPKSQVRFQALINADKKNAA